MLLRYLSPNNEILLVADDKQNLYDRKLSWINQSMSGLGYKFRGRWSKLNKNIRNQHYPEILTESNRFAKQFLQEYLQNNPDKNFGSILFDESPKEQTLTGFAKMYWCNVLQENHQESIILDKILKAYRFITTDTSTQYKDSDIAILLTRTKLLSAVVEYLKKAGIHCVNTLKDKENFSIQDPHIKIATVHSFKGMETKAVIFVNDAKYDIQNIFETYIAITRATELIVVFNRVRELEEYGKGWNKFRPI